MSRADELYKQTCLKILTEGFSDEGLMDSLARLKELSEGNSPHIVDEIAALVTTYHREPVGV